MKYIFCIFLFAFVGMVVPVFADTYHGKNYDKEIISVTGDLRPIYKWISKPDRIQDIDDRGITVWVDYKVREDQNNIYFDSATGSYVLNKDSCTIHIKKGSDEKSLIKEKIISHTIKEALNGTDSWHVADAQALPCQMDYSVNDGVVQVNAKKGDFTITYYFDYAYGFEFIYKYTNTNPSKTNHKYGFTMSCTGADCDEIKINGLPLENQEISKEQLIGKKITIGNKKFDPQDAKHGYLWMIKKESDKMVADFTDSKGPLSINQTLVVDPTFSSNNPTVDGYVSDEDNDDNCEASPAIILKDTSSARIESGRRANSEGSDCSRGFSEYDISSLSTTIDVFDSDFQFAVGQIVGTPNGCDFVSMSSQPSVATDSNIWSAIGSGTVLVDNNSLCNSSGNNKSVDLGSNGDSYIESQRGSSLSWAAIGVKSEVEGALDGSFHLSRIASEENATATPKPTLVIQYITGSLTPPTNLNAESQGRNVQFSWTPATPHSDLTGYYIGRSLDNSTWPAANKTAIGNVTSYFSTSYWRINQLYYYNITSSNSISNATAFGSFTTDNTPSAPQDTVARGQSDTRIKLNWEPPSSTGNDSIIGYRIDYCITCTSWSTLVNSTNTLNYNQTGLSGPITVKYRMAAWNGVGLGTFTANFTGSTYQITTGSIVLASGVIGDVAQINGTVTVATGYPTPVNITQSRLYVDGVISQTRSETLSINPPGTQNLDPFWHSFTDSANHIFSIKVTATNATGTETLSTVTNATLSREYPPTYFDPLTVDPNLGIVNYTVLRFDNEDGVQLKVNRQNVAVGQTWPISCILQTNSEAAQTKNQSLTWQGTWRNFTDVGYFNSTWDGIRNTHGYITCVNPPNILFTTTSFTNSSLALFGIEIFDNSYGAMLGVPVGIFFLAMAGAMANKRTAPTWIIVVLGIAGTMATIGFFTINPLIWGLALVTGMLGVLVNQKVF